MGSEELMKRWSSEKVASVPSTAEREEEARMWEGLDSKLICLLAEVRYVLCKVGN